MVAHFLGLNNSSVSYYTTVSKNLINLTTWLITCSAGDYQLEVERSTLTVFRSKFTELSNCSNTLPPIPFTLYMYFSGGMRLPWIQGLQCAYTTNVLVNTVDWHHFKITECIPIPQKGSDITVRVHVQQQFKLVNTLTSDSDSSERFHFSKIPVFSCHQHYHLGKIFYKEFCRLHLDGMLSVGDKKCHISSAG